jgi:hypothetical protein
MMIEMAFALVRRNPRNSAGITKNTPGSPVTGAPAW